MCVCVLRKCDSEDHKPWELSVSGSQLNRRGASQGLLHHYMDIIYFVYCSRLESVRSKQWPESKRKAVCVVELILSHVYLALLLEKSLKIFIGKIGISDTKRLPVLV